MKADTIMDINCSTELFNGALFLPPTDNLDLGDPLSAEFIKDFEEFADSGADELFSELGIDNMNASVLETLQMLAKPDPQMVLFQQAFVNIDYYFVPLILLVGVAGNTLSFVVFVATHLKRSSCHIYLASLAMADNVFLFCVFISWGEHIGISLYKQSGWCQTLMYLTYVSSFLSVWYVVSFTVERWLITCHPLKRNRLYTTKMAKIVVISLALFSCIAYSYTIFTSGVYEMSPEWKECAPLPQFYNVVSTVNNIDTLITLIIPTFIIIGCNIRITLVVCSFYKAYSDTPRRCAVLQKWDFSHPQGNRKYRQEVSWNSNNNMGIVVQKPINLNITRTSHMRATRMLLIVSTVFLVCNLPSHAARTYSFVMNLVDESWRQPTVFILIQKLFQILNYINFSVNFFLYSLSGRSFRNGLKRLKLKVKKKVKTVTCVRHDDISLNSSPRMLSNKTDLQLPSYL